MFTKSLIVLLGSLTVAQAQYNERPEPPPRYDGGLGLGALLLVTGTAAGGFIIWVYTHNLPAIAEVKLQRTTDCGKHWEDLDVSIFFLNEAPTPISGFRIAGDKALYRVTVKRV